AQLPQFTKIGAQLPGQSPTRSLLYKISGLVIVISLVAEYGFGLTAMAFVRAAVVTAVILYAVQPWRLPVARTTLARCVWLAHWFVILGVWLAAALPRYRIDFLHVLFIGGFTLMILAIGTRVTLSHGGHALAQEQRSWPLRIGLTTGLIALLARLGAPFAGFTYFAHLAWAAIFWIGGMLFWGFYLVKLMRKAPQ
ncbi:MAG TPA: NnrS family protein, partial [Gemmatimonadaceae bacterium]|nr:NnrS family protein [Gemmatimonadaceae bacterium]